MSSDDIWRQFGIATWRARRARLLVAVASWLSLVIIVVAPWWSAAITPHIRWEIDEFFVRAEVDENGVLSTRAFIELENEGLASVTLTDISMEIPGLRLIPADKADEESSVVTLERGGSATVSRRIVITDCAAVPHEPQPMRFTYRAWTGSGSAEAPADSWQLTGPTGRIPLAWQRGLADDVCNDAVSPRWP
ncbi:hypothetical protein [Nonomuraea sp. NEAU-A123]|uniref:hypothetical protein n=1 Tax=Nonomuraea sp. NEAU-A123 TaxID=2839649 RepID=UPI001BE3EF5C|nr:hypothetical protein [Nonomuraea sp. NEAU-A123]MBT2234660.1 hypothetical protein [Nonomuraea sp. NEAU-A123]